jgi:uncharacterized protein YjbI with pentapeptide repeats
MAQENPDVVPDLSSADLQDVHLDAERHAEAERPYLRIWDLQGVNLHAANLSGGTFAAGFDMPI